MQRNTGTATGTGGGKKEKDFDSMFDKFAGKLTTEYKGQFKKVEYAGPKSKQQKINNAYRQGKNVEVVKKAGGNKTNIVNVGQLLSDDVIIEVKTNPKELGIQVSKQRMEKKLTQEQLATKINEQSSVIKDMENGSGVYNANNVTKIEKALDFKINRTWNAKK